MTAARARTEASGAGATAVGVDVLLGRLAAELHRIRGHAITLDAALAMLIEDRRGSAEGLGVPLQSSDMICQSIDGLADFCAVLARAAPRDGARITLDEAHQVLRLEVQKTALSGDASTPPARGGEAELW